MQALLRGLAESNRGLCVITSRLPINDLTDYEGRQAQRIDLEDLLPEAGAELLKERGVVGPEEELREASTEFGGHPLALTLLGNYLRDVQGGQIARRDRVDILEQDKEEGGHARRVMAAYERWFKENPELKEDGEERESPELAVLRMIALFDRPADGAAIAALRHKADIPHLTEPLKNLSGQKWLRALVRLRAAGLIAKQENQQDDTLDAHPLVREYFKKQLKEEHPDAWRKGNDELFNLRRRSVDLRPDTREEIDVLYAAIPHGCQADRHERAFREVYFGRIQQDKKFFAPNKLGTVSNDLDALSCFFDAPEDHPGDPAWKHPVKSIKGRWRALLFGQAGYRLWMLGRLQEAITPMTEALNADVARAKAAGGEGEACEAWNYASVDADTLGSIYLNLGDLNEALSYSHLGVKYAFASGIKNQIVSALSTLGDVLHHNGYLSESRETFAHAAQIKGSDWQTTSFPHSLGHRRRDLLLSLGAYPEVQRTTEHILQSQKPEDFTLIDLALLHLSLGQAHLFQAAHRETTHYALARHNLMKAMDELRRAGRVIHLPRGRLALAKLHLMAESWPEVKTDVDEALGTAVRGQMELHQADCHLSYARLYLAQGETEGAARSLAQAEEIIARCGYRPREVDVQLLRARLGIARNEKEHARRNLSEAKMLVALMGYRRRDRDFEAVEELLR
jgi:tetratricopeptide (TPR) repeat protein